MRSNISLAALLVLSGCGSCSRLDLSDPSFTSVSFGGYTAFDVTGDGQVDVVARLDRIMINGLPSNGTYRAVFAAPDVYPFDDTLARARPLDPTWRAEFSSYLAASCALRHQREQLGTQGVALSKSLRETIP